MLPLRLSLAFATLVLPAHAAIVPERTLASPDGKLVFALERDDSTQALLHSVTDNGRAVVTRGALGLDITGVGVVADQGTISNVVADSIDSSWTNAFGERSAVSDKYRQETLTISHADQGSLGVKLQVRVYDDGVALRYLIEGTGSIASDKTSFPLPTTTQVWTSGTAQASISKQAISSVSGAVERPVLAELATDLYAALGEAGLVDSSRMKFTRTGTSTLVASLAGSIAFTTTYTSPWRFVRVAPSPGSLLEGNHFMLNLCEPSQVADTSWIRPGKVLREVTLTTQGSMACIDFAAAHDLKYIMFDAGWYGAETSAASDASEVNVDPARSPGPLDLPAVIAYGKTKGVDVILYVNQIALSQQLDEILPLYQSWGVAGIKFGFVHVGSQANTRWLHEAVRKCAEHQLMVNIHDEYRPTGVSRTFPNLLTQEGIRGDEETPSNATVLNTIFTRGLAGAGDQTNCYFASRVNTMGSHASQLAKSVCIFSPWQFLYWYDRPLGSPGSAGAGGSVSVLEEVPELTFFDRLPTTWDETRVLDGYPGSHATIARRKGGIWFVGALNGNTARDFTVPLDFLPAGQNFRLELYRDDTTVATSTKVKVGHSVVNRDSTIQRTVRVGNGFAAILTPTTDALTAPDVDPPPRPPPPVPPGTIKFETTEGYPAANADIAVISSNANGQPYTGSKGWSLASSGSPGRVLATQDSGDYVGGQALGTNGSSTYVGGVKGIIEPAAACTLSFDAQYNTGISVAFMKDVDGDGLFDATDTGMSFGIGGASTVRFQRRGPNFGTETASPLAGSGGQWYRFLITFGTSNAGSRPVTMAVRNLTTGIDLDFDSATAGIQPWSFNVTAAELGPAPETADGVFVRLTGAAKIDNLRATIIGTPYQSWMSGFPAIAGNNRSTDADPDRDGVVNLLEWVLDGDPASSDASVLPAARISEGNLIFTFNRRDDSEGRVSTIVQHGTDLIEWTNLLIGAADAAGYAVDEQGESPDAVTVRLPVAGEPKRFVRLLATESAP
ncbi:glycoside hydrolase family 97 protein [Luteolibacter arcticus]|uniref:Glycoside hydrolase family 97 protein n=1 Tax=Luteolibacter arcticus TaxID=1581411 RepID=A0ABT3GNH5_9BACT|nr:glycoside hydrolase family 97 protein [Luteolibacter arcticus]MCW1925052.1 glycoside hydrolase family 97 protein [Luteolibacter arcticus]